MTGKTITLPIKCSTFNKWYDIIKTTMLIFGFIYGATSVLYVYTQVLGHVQNTLYELTLGVLAVYGSCLFALACVLICLWFYEDYAPNFKCIPD